MKCIILAAGYATRLYPLTENFPKPLLEVGNKPILDWLIEDLDSVIEEFIVVTNHKYYDHFINWSTGKRVIVLDDGTTCNEKRLGAVNDIKLAVDCLKLKEDCMVMAGDNMLDFSLKRFVEFFKSKDSSCVMFYKENKLEALQKTAVITINNDSLITSYEEKPEKPKSNLAVPPFYIYKTKDLKRVSEALENGCGYDAPGSFAAWLSIQTDMYAYKMFGNRYDIGDFNNYARIRDRFH